jgi:hypothetical protein
MTGGRETAHVGADFGEDGPCRKSLTPGIVHKRAIRDRRWPDRPRASCLPSAQQRAELLQLRFRHEARRNPTVTRSVIHMASFMSVLRPGTFLMSETADDLRFHHAGSNQTKLRTEPVPEICTGR